MILQWPQSTSLLKRLVAESTTSASTTGRPYQEASPILPRIIDYFEVILQASPTGLSSLSNRLGPLWTAVPRSTTTSTTTGWKLESTKLPRWSYGNVSNRLGRRGDPIKRHLQATTSATTGWKLLRLLRRIGQWSQWILSRGDPTMRPLLQASPTSLSKRLVAGATTSTTTG